MKYAYVLALMATAALMGCSDDLFDPDGSARYNLTGGDAYVALRVKLPVATSGNGRSDYADEYLDGEDFEYAVKDAQVLIFSTPTDSDADESTYAYEGTSPFIKLVWDKDASSSVSTEGWGVVQLSFYPEEDKDYYALVVFNRNHVLDALNESLGSSITTYGDINSMPVGYGNSAYMMTGINYNEIADRVAAGTLSPDATTYSGADGSDCDMYYPMKGGIFMTNALRYIDGKLTTLVQIKPEQFADDVDAAMQNTGEPIHVERGVAKITIKYDGPESSALWSDAGYTIGSYGGDYAGDNVRFLAWDTDNSTATSYIVHTVDGIADFTTNYLDNDSYSYLIGANNRLQWSYAPRYDIASMTYDTNTQLYMNTDGTEYKTELFGNVSAKVYLPKNRPKYVLENTQAPANMYTAVSTRVVFKAQYTPKGFARGQSFCILNGQIYRMNNSDTTDGYDYPAIDDYLRSFVKDEYTYTYWSDTYVEGSTLYYVVDDLRYYTEEDLAYMEEKGWTIPDGTWQYRVTDTVAIDKDAITFDFTEKNIYTSFGNNIPYASGVSDSVILYGIVGLEVYPTSVQSQILNDLSEPLNPGTYNNHPLYVYHDGICYYSSYIRHFTDDVSDNVKWEGGFFEIGFYPNSEASYQLYNPYSDAYLGRWGVVRNNWYELEPTAVYGIGMLYETDEELLYLLKDNGAIDNGAYFGITCTKKTMSNRVMNTTLQLE